LRRLPLNFSPSKEVTTHIASTRWRRCDTDPLLICSAAYTWCTIEYRPFFISISLPSSSTTRPFMHAFLRSSPYTRTLALLTTRYLNRYTSTNTCMCLPTWPTMCVTVFSRINVIADPTE
jgi:hypothetical protein